MSASSQSLGLAESQDLPVAGDVEYELEDPAESWLALVKACRLPNMRARRSAVNTLLLKAKNSHWTDLLWTEIQEGYDSPTMGGDAEEGGSYAESTYDGPRDLARTKVTARLECFRCGRPIQYCACYRASADARCPTCGQLWNNCSCTITS